MTTNTDTFLTVKVIFRNPINQIDKDFFPQEEWEEYMCLETFINSYPGTRFTAIDEKSAIITSDPFNMPFVVRYLLGSKIPIECIDTIPKKGMFN